MSTLPAVQLSDPRDFGHVGLLIGGESAERDVSLDGGAAIGRSFERSGIEYSTFDGPGGLFDSLRAGQIDRVFNLMHGPGGEDGAIQGALQLMKVPVTGAGVLGSALTMDKIRSKWIMQRLGLPTAEFELLGPEDPLPDIDDLFGFPVFVKPSGLGSSIGISRVSVPGGLEKAVHEARKHGQFVLIEPAIDGSEYFAGVVGRTVLPLIRIETPREFYDYEAKYHSDQTSYHCPCGLPAELEEELQARSLEVFDALQASGWGRVDFILDPAGRPCFLEVNTAPGMTDHSLVPQAAAQIGVGFDELVWRILETSL